MEIEAWSDGQVPGPWFPVEGEAVERGGGQSGFVEGEAGPFQEDDGEVASLVGWRGEGSFREVGHPFLAAFWGVHEPDAGRLQFFAVFEDEL